MPPNRGGVLVSLPHNATLTANDQEVPVPRPDTLFLTPQLDPGRDYYYDFRVRVSRDGRAETRSKRVTVRAGSLTRLNYDEMTPGDRRDDRRDDRPGDRPGDRDRGDDR